MEIGKRIILFTCMILQLVNAARLTIKVGGSDNNNCGTTYTIRDSDDDGYMISWDGRSVTNNCKLSIKGENELEVCAALVTNAMPDCRPRVKIYDGSDTDYHQVKSVGCGLNDINMCTGSEGTITVKFIDANFLSASNVTIKVYGRGVEDDDDDDDNYYYLIQPLAYAGGAILVIIGTAVGWCVFLKISRKRERQRKAMVAANPPLSWAQQAQAQQNQGYTYNTNQNYMYPVASSNPVEKV